MNNGMEPKHEHPEIINMDITFLFFENFSGIG